MNPMNINTQFKSRMDTLLQGLQMNQRSKDMYTRFKTLKLPQRSEDWKYSNLNGLASQDYTVSKTGSTEPNYREELDIAYSNRLVFVDGIFHKRMSSIEEGTVELVSVSDASVEKLVQDLDTHFDDKEDFFFTLNAAAVQNLSMVRIKKGKKENLKKNLKEHLIHLVHINTGNTFSAYRHIVEVEKDASAHMVSEYVNLSEQEYPLNSVLNQHYLHPRAEFQHTSLYLRSQNLYQVSHTQVFQKEGSKSDYNVYATCGAMVRNNYQVDLMEKNANASIQGACVLKGKNHVDNFIQVNHLAGNTFSHQNLRNILDERAKGVFTGKIFVQKDAQKIEAYQSNKNIVLSEKASMHARPQLEILADDVRCSHGCTIGSLDPMSIFYLRSRGITRKKAEAFLACAFVDSIVEALPIEVLRTYIQTLFSKQLQ